MLRSTLITPLLWGFKYAVTKVHALIIYWFLHYETPCANNFEIPDCKKPPYISISFCQLGMYTPELQLAWRKWCSKQSGDMGSAMWSMCDFVFLWKPHSCWLNLQIVLVKSLFLCETSISDGIWWYPTALRPYLRRCGKTHGPMAPGKWSANGGHILLTI
jgi:hypothetical protein